MAKGTSSVTEAVVYRAVNIVNGKSYIGVTKTGLYVRERAHRNLADRGIGNLLQRAIRKYGQDNIIFSVLSSFGDDYDLARIYEWEMISKHRPAYNLSAGGEGGTTHESTRSKIRAKLLGRTCSPEAAAKRKGRKLSEKHRKNIAKSTTGRKHTEGTLQKLRGRVIPESTRSKISETLKQREWVDTPARVESRERVGVHRANEAHRRPVVCLTDGRSFSSQSEAAKFYGISAVHLGQAIITGRAASGLRFARPRAVE